MEVKLLALGPKFRGWCLQAVNLQNSQNQRISLRMWSACWRVYRKQAPRPGKTADHKPIESDRLKFHLEANQPED